jgi:hypothetical protein
MHDYAIGLFRIVSNETLTVMLTEFKSSLLCDKTRRKNATFLHVKLHVTFPLPNK